jgi:predicted DNA-binding transcriptional regulator AlpA
MMNQQIQPLAPPRVMLPSKGFARLWQIIGDPSRDALPVIPVSKAEFWRGVESGAFPKPIKLSPRVTVWKAEDVWDLYEKLSENREVSV